MIKRIFLILLSNILLLIILFIGAGVATRFYINIWRGGFEYKPDKLLGWAPKKNYRITRMDKDLSGHEYKVQYSTNEHGFRAWGDLDGKPKILFIGDSFTGDAYTSNSDAYFNIAGNHLDAEIFAIGGGGYGTLQEYLLLKKYAHIIEPDIFVLEFCSNDFSNNHMKMEEHFISRNQTLMRPYLTDEGIKFRENGTIYSYLLHNSSFFRDFDIIIQKFQNILYDGYYKPEDKKLIDGYFEESIRTTDKIFKMIDNELPDDTLKLSFICSSEDEKEIDAWKTIAENNNFIPLENVSLAVEKAERDGKTVRYRDGGHWNILGNHIAGEQLAHDIKKIINNNKIEQN